MENSEPGISPASDPVVAAAKTLLGVSYLYPYQRLVIANLLDAAAAAGLDFAYPVSEPGIAPVADPDREPGENHGNQIDNGMDHSDQIDGDMDHGDQIDADTDLGRQIVILPTGAGKSLCFQLPALLLKRPTLVLYPILSLMADQYRRLAERGFAPALLRGGQDAAERQKIWNRMDSGDCPFVIANPEVLLTEKVMRRLPDLKIGHLVIDEAHCVSEWGESFRPSYLRIAEILAAARAPLATAFTATASPAVLDKIRRYVFGAAGARTVLGNPDRPNIFYAAQGAILRDRATADLLRTKKRPAIVFCSSRARTESLARYLRASLNEAELWFYHAGLSREEKTETEKRFFASGRGILTATCAYGLGVDKSDIRTVIHRDCPPGVEAYLQESGRAGRDGESAEAVLIWGPDDERRTAHLAANAPSTPRAAEDLARFQRLLAYARDSGHCRRDSLLGMLGVETEWCSGCDVCRGQGHERIRETAAFRDFISRNRRRYSLDDAARYIAAVYSGDWEAVEAARVLRVLLKQGSITVSRHPFKGKLSVPR